MDSSNDNIGNRTRDTPACGAVLQPTAPPSVPAGYSTQTKTYIILEKGVSIPSCRNVHGIAQCHGGILSACLREGKQSS
jgi:hypothetical protein